MGVEIIKMGTGDPDRGAIGVLNFHIELMLWVWKSLIGLGRGVVFRVRAGKDWTSPEGRHLSFSISVHAVWFCSVQNILALPGTRDWERNQRMRRGSGAGQKVQVIREPSRRLSSLFAQRARAVRII